MSEQLGAHAADLRIVESDGGWEPSEGTELTVVVRLGKGNEAMSISPVRRIVTTSDAWLVWSAERDEVTWVRSEWVISVRSTGGADVGRERRPGFA